MNLSAQINRYDNTTPMTFNLGQTDLGALAKTLALAEELERERQLQALKRKYQGKVHLYGGTNGHDIYLGCLNCSAYDELSVWNGQGKYGLKSFFFGSDDNIWNDESKFGSSSGSYSPWSSYAGYPPAIVDFYGEFYGYFTGNKNKELKIEYELFTYIIENHTYIKKNYSSFGACFREDGSFDVNLWERILDNEANYNKTPSDSSNKYGYKVSFSTVVKSSGQIWVEAQQGRSIAPISKGTHVQVIGYKDGFWKIISNGLIGYLSRHTIDETPEMLRFKRSIE